MTIRDGGDDHERIDRIRAAWETFDNTGDVTAIADYLAEDIVLMPPGAPSVTGKEAVVAALTPPDDGYYEADTNQVSESLFVSGDLAVDRITVTGTRDTTPGESWADVNLKGIDVYRRDADGAWKCIVAIWNSQA